MLENPIIVNQFLTDIGDGTGVSNAIGDFTTPGIFFIQPAASEVMIINHLTIHITDSGVLPIGVYGGLASALGVGIDIQVTDDRSMSRSILPDLITENSDLVHMGVGNFNLINFTANVDALVARLNFNEGNLPIKLQGSKGHKIEILLADDFTGLIDHHFIAHGYK